MTKRNNNILLCIIMFLGVFLRLIQLNVVPPGFYCDEAAEGYTTYSLLTTGRDIEGNALPVFFRSIANDIHGGIYTYSMLPFVAIFGLNEFSVRATSAMWGILTIFILYYFVKKAYNNKIALISSFLLTVSPWHLQFSRIGFRAIIYPLFIILGLLFFIKGLQKNRYLYISAIVFALSIYTYSIARIFTPLLIIGIIVFYHKELLKNKRYLFISMGIFITLILPLLFWLIFRREEFLCRFKEVSVFVNNDNIINMLKQFFENYASYYSPAFLFLKGDGILRHSLRGHGLLYLYTAPFVLYGIFVLIRRKAPIDSIMLYWLVLFPVPASLTGNTTHAIRSINALPLFQILTAVGIYNIIKLIRSKGKTHKAFIFRIIFIIYMVFCLFSIINYLKDYFIKYKKYAAFDFQYGFKEAVNYADSIKNNYDYIYETGYDEGLEILTAFFIKYPPEQYQANKMNGSKYKIANSFTEIKKDFYLNDKRALYLTKSLEFTGKTPVKEVYFPDNKIAYKLISKTDFKEYDEQLYIDEMITELQLLLDGNPQLRFQVYNEIGMLYYQKEDILKAKEAFLQAVTENPYYTTAFANLGVIYRMLGEYNNALEMFKKVIKHEPGFTIIHYNMGIVYYKLKDYNNSLHEFNEYIRKNPNAKNINQVKERIKTIRALVNN